MKLTELSLKGAYVIEQSRVADDRGFFTRVYCETELGNVINSVIRQSNFSFSKYAGTTRGLHSQYPPFAEDKLLYCPHGELVNIIVDIRPNSPTFLQHEIIHLTSQNGLMTLVPRGFANGIQTLKNDTCLCYLVSNFYQPDAEIGLSIFDPKLDIRLPMTPTVISSKDSSWPLIGGQNFNLDFSKFS